MLSILLSFLKIICYLTTHSIFIIALVYIPFEYDFSLKDISIISSLLVLDNITILGFNLIFNYIFVKMNDRINQYSAIMFNLIFGVCFSIPSLYGQYLLKVQLVNGVILMLIIMISMILLIIPNVIIQQVINIGSLDTKLIVEDYDSK